MPPRPPFGPVQGSDPLEQHTKSNGRLPQKLACALRRHQILPGRFILSVSLSEQRMRLLEKIFDDPSHLMRTSLTALARMRLLAKSSDGTPAAHEMLQSNKGSTFNIQRSRFEVRKTFLISSSRFGVGQKAGSNQTPLGLHRIARKIGAGQPIGAVFRNRKMIGLSWQGLPDASIVHRILWLEGLEPGYNRGDGVDTFQRYIYIHGFGDETSLGRPASHGCI